MGYHGPSWTTQVHPWPWPTMHGRSWVMQIAWISMDSHGHRVCPMTTHLLPFGPEHAWGMVRGAHPMDTHRHPWAPSTSQDHPHAAHVAQHASQAPETSLALPACRIALEHAKQCLSCLCRPHSRVGRLLSAAAAGTQYQAAAQATLRCKLAPKLGHPIVRWCQASYIYLYLYTYIYIGGLATHPSAWPSRPRHRLSGLSVKNHCRINAAKM